MLLPSQGLHLPLSSAFNRDHETRFSQWDENGQEAQDAAVLSQSSSCW
jgi:hypothetical protein